jgi:hypothetical protein
MDGPQIAVRCDSGHWTAWALSAPQTAFGGPSPGEALDRLLAFSPDVSVQAAVTIRPCSTAIRSPDCQSGDLSGN